MGESRQELLAWLNDLLQLNITKVEQCGTGAALCQIYDSIFQDIPMSRVKFNVNTEYAYLQNFKILSNAFSRHGIERSVPVESLVKCKMQDNLEFLQWTKRYWDQYFPGGEYDPFARRKGAGTTAPPSAATTPSAQRTPGAGAARRTGSSGTTGSSSSRMVSAAKPRIGGANHTVTSAVLEEVQNLKSAVESLERERDFYFSKLRDIELLIQQAVEADPELEKDEDGLVKQIENILYTTEEGFEIPEGEEAIVDEAETF